MIRCACAMWLLVLALAAPARADECDVTWSSVGDDFVAMLEAPFHMTSDEAAATLGVTAFVGASIAWWDYDVDRWVARQPDSFAYTAMHQLTRLASWYGENNTNALITSAAVTGAVAIGGVIADDDYLLDTAAIMAESAAFSFVLDVAAKLLVERARPRTGMGAHKFSFLASPTNSGMHSFLSGHTANAFALAGAAAGRYPHWYIEIPGYTLAVAAGLQRMDVREHWMSDVASGAFFGYAIAEFLVDRHECDDDASADATGPTVSISFQF